jgi:hypothetical protein
MNSQITLSDVTAIAGLIFGLSGLVLSISNYLRDKPRIVIHLKWDMTRRMDTGIEMQVGVITISNVGRRPVYISHAALKFPKESKKSHLIINDSVKGQKLVEGDSPIIFTIPQNALREYARYWKGIRAQVSDSTGKVWFSKKIKSKPLWVGDET